MKILNKILLSVCAAVLAVALIPATATAASEPIQITWWHSMGGDLGKEVNKLADQFNQSQSKYEVVPKYKGRYSESMTQAIAAFRAGNQPDILQVYEVGTGAMLAAGNAVVPVYKLMQKNGIDFSADQFVPAISSYYSNADGQMLSMAFNTSTPVMYYNKDEFKKAGIENPPKTWQELQKVAQKLVDSGVECGYTTGWQSWINIENYAAWHNLPFATNHNGYADGDEPTKLLINTKPFVEHIARLADMAQSGLFTYGGRASKAKPLFLSGTCAMYTDSSGGLVPIVNNAKFNVGVTMMPYNSDVVEHPQNSLLGGGTLWVLSGNDESHYPGIAQFLAFLAQPEQQAQWSKATGYVPVTKAAYQYMKDQGYYDKFPGAAVGVKELSLNKPTKNSQGIRLGAYVQYRKIINQELEQVWSGEKTAQEALDATVERTNKKLARFAAQHSK